jgi:hypothetical protein
LSTDLSTNEVENVDNQAKRWIIQIWILYAKNHVLKRLFVA